MGGCDFGEGDVLVRDVQFAGLLGVGGCGVGFVGGDCEGGDDGVGVVVALEVAAEELVAFDVEEGAVEEF